MLFNAHRSKKIPWKELEQILPTLATLNGKALETALKFDVYGGADVKGFAIMGHTSEMAKASGMSPTI